MAMPWSRRKSGIIQWSNNDKQTEKKKNNNVPGILLVLQLTQISYIGFLVFIMFVFLVMALYDFSLLFLYILYGFLEYGLWQNTACIFYFILVLQLWVAIELLQYLNIYSRCTLAVAMAKQLESHYRWWSSVPMHPIHGIGVAARM